MMSYVVFIAAVMLVLPVVSYLSQKSSLPIDGDALGKWFIFWGVGIRLLVAGLMQVFKPAFTASILHLEVSAFVILRELGLANIIFGLLGMLSFFRTDLRLAANAGGFYMGLAGIIHVISHSEKSDIKETVALASDLWIFVVVIIYCIYTLRK